MEPGSPREAEAIATGRHPFPWWRPGSYYWLPRAAGRLVTFRTAFTVWHVDPGGDGDAVCRQYVREPAGPGAETVSRRLNGWRWHVWHFEITWHDWRRLRRWVLTRCAWCGGRHRRGDEVNVSNTGYGAAPRGPWWAGERHLYHADCAFVERAHGRCLCDGQLSVAEWCLCAVCGKRRVGPLDREYLAELRARAAVPRGERARELWAGILAKYNARMAAGRDARRVAGRTRG